eukprot:COSAG02_NODE_13589_length_1375_cov_1.721003_1_plen_87_part_01
MAADEDSLLPPRPPPHEFTAEAVAAASATERQLFQRFHGTVGGLHSSLARQGLTFVKDMTSSTHLSDDDSHYYNTTGSALDYWQGEP